MVNRLLCFGCFFLWIAVPLDVLASQLKDVRIGVHRGFSRVVFQLDTLTEIEGPVIQGSGKCSLKFKKTESPFISHIPGHLKARVEGIELIQDGEDLIVYLRLGIDAFELNSFSLPDPPRIVLDIYRLRESLTKSPGIAPAAADPDNVVPHKLRLGKKSIIEDRPLSGDTRPDERHDLNAMDMEETPLPESKTVSTSPDAPEGKRPGESLPAPPLKPVIAEKPTVTVVQTPIGPLRTYLWVLLGISVVMLILLSVLVFRKTGAFEKKKKEEERDRESQFDHTLTAIDERINQKLAELDQNFRSHRR